MCIRDRPAAGGCWHGFGVARHRRQVTGRGARLDVPARARTRCRLRERPAAGLPDVPVRPGAPQVALLGLIGGPLVLVSGIATLLGAYKQVSPGDGDRDDPGVRVGAVAGHLPHREGIQAVPLATGTIPAMPTTRSPGAPSQPAPATPVG